MEKGISGLSANSTPEIYQALNELFINSSQSFFEEIELTVTQDSGDVCHLSKREGKFWQINGEQSYFDYDQNKCYEFFQIHQEVKLSLEVLRLLILLQ